MNNKILYLNTVISNIEEIIEQLNFSGKELDQLTEDEKIKLFEETPLETLEVHNQEYIRSEIHNFHKQSLLAFKENIDVLERKWGSAFAYYDFFLDFYIGFSDSLTELIKQHETSIDKYSNTLAALRYLNGRAIQIANGILVSLRNGYPDDAYARSRTLYELMITISFISSHGEIVAESYIEYKGEWYHWADSVITKKRITFTDLERCCVLEKEFVDKWKFAQKNMHKVIHASPQGTFSRIGGYMKKSVPIGPTDASIYIVAIETIRLMNAIFICYLSCVVKTEDLKVELLIKSYFTTLKNITDKMEVEFSKLKEMNFKKKSDLSN